MDSCHAPSSRQTHHYPKKQCFYAVNVRYTETVTVTPRMPYNTGRARFQALYR